MRRHISILVVLLLALTSALFAQVPLAITSISPDRAFAGSPTFTLTVTGTGFQAIAVGSGFLSLSQVRWNGVNIPTTYDTPTTRVATVDASLVASPGTAAVDVVNPSGPPSNSMVFTILTPLAITTNSPLPTATVGVNYSRQLAGVGGTQPYSWYWNPASDIGSLPPGLSLDYYTGVISGIPSAAGTYSVVVTLLDGYENQVDKTFQLIINPPAPLTIASISPNHTTAGTGTFTLIVTGSGFFAQTSMVYWNGSELATTFDIATQLRADVPASLISQPGSATVQVVDLEMQRSSNSVIFRVWARPAITSTTLPDGEVGAPYSEPIQYTCPNGPCAWSIPSGTMPPGMDLNADGSVIGTPTRAGAYTFTVGVTDGAGVLASADITLTVIAAPAITTGSPLPNGIVGLAYSQAFAATGGTPAYTWTAQTSALPPGLTVSTAGVLSGTPSQAGTFTFTVTVTDSAQGTAAKQFSLTVNPALSITTVSPLPNGTVGTAYSQQTFTAEGGTLPYTWTSPTSALPPGLTASAAGVLSGTPTQAGTFTFTVTVTDSAQSTAAKQFSLTVDPPLSITTASPLPGGTVGTAYSQLTFAATAGTPAYSWTPQTSALPPGLTVSTAGVLSGTPTQAGTSTFTVTVTDNAGSTASKQFTLIVALPPATAPSVAVSSSSPGPAQQPTVNVQLGAPYTLQMTGVLTLTFAPDAVASADDPAIQFSSGGRTLPFTIPAGQTSAFSTLPTLQTGTVAGSITLTITQLVAGGQSVLPSPAPIQTITVARSAPVITSVQVSKVSPGFSVLIRGYSTPRQMTQATFIFTGTNLQGASAVIQVDIPFGAWYAGTSSTSFGSQFLYTQPFTIQGDISAITSVSVTLQNSSGSSQAVSASF